MEMSFQKEGSFFVHRGLTKRKICAARFRGIGICDAKARLCDEGCVPSLFHHTEVLYGWIFAQVETKIVQDHSRHGTAS